MNLVINSYRENSLGSALRNKNNTLWLAPLAFPDHHPSTSQNTRLWISPKKK
jgi:hypothetical protein